MQKKWHIEERRNSNLFNHLLKLRNFTESDLNTPTINEILLQIFNEFPQLTTAVEVVNKAIDNNQPIVIHGDYDADGICATAILWEVLCRDLGYKNTFPFIPNRFNHGYGLSKESLQEIEALHPHALIITVDCGVTAVEEVEIAKQKGFTVIVTDHHAAGAVLPEADVLLHTSKLAGAGVAWVLGEFIIRGFSTRDSPRSNDNRSNCREAGLDLVALATIADIQPLTGYNRTLVKQGLNRINSRPRLGLLELMRVSGLLGKVVSAWEIGWLLAPRINASGRLADAREALRLLVTENREQAVEISLKLETANKERQRLTTDTYYKACKLLNITKETCVEDLPSILCAVSADFHEGIIGLVAGKLCQNFNRPAVLIAQNGTIAKGSARSIEGINIIELLRNLENLSSGMGGHSGAAGFSVAAGGLQTFQEALLKQADTINRELLTQTIHIDAQIGAHEINYALYNFLNSLEPFGEGNKKPKFVVNSVAVKNYQFLGTEQTHLKLILREGERLITALWFSFPQQIKPYLKIGANVDLVFTLEENRYNGNKELQLMVKDMLF